MRKKIIKKKEGAGKVDYLRNNKTSCIENTTEKLKEVNIQSTMSTIK